MRKNHSHSPVVYWFEGIQGNVHISAMDENSIDCDRYSRADSDYSLPVSIWFLVRMRAGRKIERIKNSRWTRLSIG